LKMPNLHLNQKEFTLQKNPNYEKTYTNTFSFLNDF